MAISPLRPAASSLASDLDALRGTSRQQAVVADVVSRIAAAGARLAELIAVSPLEDASAESTGAPVNATINPSEDVQKPLDLRGEQVVVEALAGSDVAAVCSEETAEPIPVTPGGSVVVALDPIDGSGNIDINAPIGTIFSVLPALGFDDPRTALLQTGRHQLAAGLVIYGPSTILVLTLGQGTHIYVLDPRTGGYGSLRKSVTLPPDSPEYAINASNARHWHPGIRTYVNDLVSGSSGPRQRDFNMRWLASLVAETYRILRRGGIYLYPADARPGYGHGRIRLVYEANPVAFLCEQAGGAATDGRCAILDITPTDLHQRTPFVFGSRAKVDRVRRYLVDPQTSHEESPLFSNRGLFRT
jgi:fructose-1,6-bisphosphatase I